MNAKFELSAQTLLHKRPYGFGQRLAVVVVVVHFPAVVFDPDKAQRTDGGDVEIVVKGLNAAVGFDQIRLLELF